MTRDEVMSVLVRQLIRNTEGMSEDAVDPTKSLGSHGATSLDIVEILSGSAREVGVKVSRADLARLKTIDEIVDALVRAQKPSAT